MTAWGDYKQKLRNLRHEPGMKTGSLHHMADEHQGYSNYDTFQVAVTYDNDQQLYNTVRQLVRNGGDAQQLEAWATQAVIAPINQSHIQDAQSWNDTPPEERVDPNYESFKGTLGDMISPDQSDMDPSSHMINPSLVNWQELLTDLQDELGMIEPPLPQQQDAPGDLTLPEGWQ